MAMSKKAKWAVYGAIIVVAVLGISLYAGLLAIQKPAGPANPPTVTGLYKVVLTGATCAVAGAAAEVVTFPADRQSCNIYDTAADFGTPATSITMATTAQNQNTGLTTERWGFQASVVSIPQDRVTGVMVPIASYAADGIHWSMTYTPDGVVCTGVTYQYDQFIGSLPTLGVGTLSVVTAIDAGAAAAVVAGQNYPFVYNVGGVTLTATLYITA